VTHVSLKVCQDCGTAYLPADLCPQCGGGVYRFSWEEEEMAKATSGGSSNYAEGVPAAVVAEAAAEEKPAPRPRAAKARAAAEAEAAALRAQLAALEASEAGDDADTTE